MRTVPHSPVPPDQAPHAAAAAAFAEAKAFLCSREAQQMRESDLERELHRRGQELIRKLLQGHRDRCSPEDSTGPVEGADDVERSHRRLHERHPDTTSTTTFGTVQVACLSGSRLSVASRRNSTSRPPPCAASTSRVWYSTSSTWPSTSGKASHFAVLQSGVAHGGPGPPGRLGRSDSGAESAARVVNNSRFLLLPWVGVKNLASAVLARGLSQLAVDCPRRYNVEPWLVETLVDARRHHGGCYRAANFVALGSTSGRGRMHRHGRRAGAAPKTVLVYPVVRNAQRRLRES